MSFTKQSLIWQYPWSEFGKNNNIDLPSFSQQHNAHDEHRCTWIQSSNANHFGGFHLSNSTSQLPRTYLILNLARTCIVLLLRRSLRASWEVVVIKLVVFEKSLLMRGERKSHVFQIGALVRVQQELVLIVRRWNEKRRARTEA